MLASSYKHNPKLDAPVPLTWVDTVNPKLNSNMLTIRRTLIIMALVAIPITLTRMSPASIHKQDVRLAVEIDGVKFGAFDRVDGLSVLTPQTSATTASVIPRKITFKRDFVTDPSLYLWAKNAAQGRTDLRDVHVVLASREGEELARYVLRMCQPLSWSLEAASPALGGYHERIEMAVQDVAVR